MNHMHFVESSLTSVNSGRFFAVQEIQMTLVYLIKNYDIKTVSGKRPQPIAHIAGYMVTNSEEPLVFTRKN